MILLAMLFGCESWSLTLKKEYKLRLSEYRVLRRIFGRKRDEVTGGVDGYVSRSCMIVIPQKILFG
jgi:hypothetical protein